MAQRSSRICRPSWWIPCGITQALINVVINGIQAISGGGRVNVSTASAGDNLVAARAGHRPRHSAE